LGPTGRRRSAGLTRNSGIAHIARAALESACKQTRDLLDAMAQDAVRPPELRVDGGMGINSWVTQSLADKVRNPVVRPQTIETTASGASFLAGLHVGVY
jgi:glycerol kinase